MCSIPRASITRQASSNVVGSGTVGPEAMASSLSLTEFERRSVITLAGSAFLRSPPPLIWEMCFLTALRPYLSTPDLKSVTVAFSLSSMDIPGTGRARRALPPPDMRNMTRSFSPAFSSIATTSFAAFTLLSSGIGWLER